MNKNASPLSIIVDSSVTSVAEIMKALDSKGFKNTISKEESIKVSEKKMQDASVMKTVTCAVYKGGKEVGAGEDEDINEVSNMFGDTAVGCCMCVCWVLGFEEKQ